MSVAFRLFLLILFGFGAIWVYRFRSADLSEWLRPLPPLVGQTEARDPLVSPVDEVLGPDLDLGLLLLRGRELNPPWAQRRPREGGASPEGEGAGAIPAFEESFAADVVLEEGVLEEGPWEDGASGEGLDGGVEGGGAEIPRYAAPGEGEPAPEERDRAGDGSGGVPPGEGGPSGAAPPVVAYEEFFHEVKEGESLWKIAEALLGSGSRYPEIAEYNKDILSGKDISRIPVGTKLRIRRPVTQERLKDPPAQTDTSVEGNSVPGESVPEVAFASHTVQKNENLKRIARKYYPGDEEGWIRIFEANRHSLSSPDMVIEGQVLRVPLLRGRVGSRR